MLYIDSTGSRDEASLIEDAIYDHFWSDEGALPANIGRVDANQQRSEPLPLRSLGALIRARSSGAKVAAMPIARDAAPEIDRLVLDVMRAVAPRHGQAIRKVVADVGLDTMGRFSVFAEHLSPGPMPETLIDLRLKYGGLDETHRLFDQLAKLGLAERADGLLTAASGLQPLLEAIEYARTETAAHAWSGQGSTVADLLDPARQIALNATPDHDLAVLYRDIPEPSEPPALLLRRLTCLRYIRHHCHMRAWQREGLEGASMPPFTALWKEETVDAERNLSPLIERSLIEGDPPALTNAGRDTRDRIEETTNEHTEVSFNTLSSTAGTDFVNSLRQLTVQVDGSPEL